MKINIIQRLFPIAAAFLLFYVHNHYEDYFAGLIFIISGISFLYAGFSSRNSNQKIIANGIKTKAKIIDFSIEDITGSDGESHSYHFPIVKFIDRNGIETTQKLNSSSNPKRINETIEIIYAKKGNEYEILINNNFWKTHFSNIIIGLGLLLSLIGIIATIKNIQ